MAKSSTSFKKGQSGNADGRPKIVKEIQELARENTEAAMKTLVSICTNKKAPPAARVGAANAILDRGYGKAPATLTLNRTRDVSELSTEQLLAIIHDNASRDRAAGKANGSGEPDRVH